MEILDQYFSLQRQIYEYFGYAEDWMVIPLEDNREFYWHITGEGHGDSVAFAEEKADLADQDMGNYYSSNIYTQRFLPKWVYRGEKYTMICTDSGVDGNRFLSVFDNEREVK